MAEVIDSLHKTPSYVEHGHPMVRVTDVQYGELDLSKTFRVDSRVFSEFSRRYKPCWGDIVITRVGSYGIFGKVAETNFCLGQNTAAIIPKTVSPNYLYAVLNSDFVKSQVESVVVGSTQKTLSLKAIKKLLIPRLDPIQEGGIASLAATLDDRITLLRETNATLEAIAQALFKSWFVDFDPVRAKMQGRTPEGMDEATAALFPDGLEESALGLVPRGWRVARLDEFMELAYGKALKATDRIDGDVPVYGSGGITGQHNTSLADGPSVIIGRKGTVGSLYWEDQPFFAIDTVFYLKTSTPLTYCFYLLQTLGLAGMNTDAAVPGLNRNNVYRLLVAYAPSNVLQAFDNAVSLIRQKIFRNTQQAQTLATLRDTLLPRLISGALRLPQA